MDPGYRAYRRYCLAHDKEEMPIVWSKHADLCRITTSVFVVFRNHGGLGTLEPRHSRGLSHSPRTRAKAEGYF